MSMLATIIAQQNFFTIAPDFVLVDEPKNAASQEEFILLLQKLNDHVDDLSATALQDSYYFHWLTFALCRAVKFSDASSMELIAGLTLNIFRKNSHQMLTMLAKSISHGKFAGQSFMYLWMDNYYSIVCEHDSAPSALVALNLVLKEFLVTCGADFCSVLVTRINEGSERGKNSLLVLLRALLQSASFLNNQAETMLIVSLLQQCLLTAPELISLSLAEEINYGSFKGKSSVYLLACAMLKTVDFRDAASMSVMQEIMMHALKKAPEQFIEALYKIHPTGTYKGMHSFHLILLSLVSAAYVNNNSAVVEQLVAIMVELNDFPAQKNRNVDWALLELIKDGEYKALNGLAFLSRALIAGVTHHLDVSKLTDFMVQFIKRAPVDELVPALLQQASNNTTPEYTISAIQRLINHLRETKNQELPQDSIKTIINALANSPAGTQLVSFLASEDTFFFVNEAQEQSLTPAAECVVAGKLKKASSSTDTQLLPGSNGDNNKDPRFFSKREQPADNEDTSRSKPNISLI